MKDCAYNCSVFYSVGWLDVENPSLGPQRLSFTHRKISQLSRFFTFSAKSLSNKAWNVFPNFILDCMRNFCVKFAGEGAHADLYRSSARGGGAGRRLRRDAAAAAAAAPDGVRVTRARTLSPVPPVVIDVVELREKSSVQAATQNANCNISRFMTNLSDV